MKKKLTLHSGRETLQKLGVARHQLSLAPRFDISPGQLVGAVVSESGTRVFRGFRWGIVPGWWHESQRERQRLFAARAENLTRRPAFAQALKTRRAVVPVDGFWMWHVVDGQDVPFYFKARNNEPLFLAALWDDSDSEERLALVSVEANRLVEPFGARMPAVLRGDAVDLWLDEAITNPRVLVRALQAPPSRLLSVVATDEGERGWDTLRESADSRDHLALMFGRGFRLDRPHFAPRKRLVQRDHAAGGMLFFRTRSFTQDDSTRYHPIVDTENGHVFCDCPDFRYRHAAHEPDVWTPQWWCKHLSRAVANCKRHGELPARQVS